MRVLVALGGNAMTSPDGRAAPEEIAGLARGSAKRKTPQLIEAIEGNGMSDHVRFLIRGCPRSSIRSTFESPILRSLIVRVAKVATRLSNKRLKLTAHVGVFDLSPVRCSLSAIR